MEISVASTEANGFAINVSGAPVGGYLETQAAYYPDFKFCVCPIIQVPNSAQFSFWGVNPGSTYYVRARHRGSGAPGDWSNIVAVRTQPYGVRNVAPSAIMINPAIIVVPLPVMKWESATTITGFPPENLSYDGPVAWRSGAANDATPHRIIAHIAPEPVDTIAILNTNAAHNATVTVEAGGAVGSYAFSHTVDFMASPALPARPGYHALIRLPAPQSYPVWRVSILSSSAGAIFEAEHMIFGLNRSTKNYTKDKVETLQDLGSLDRSRNGNPHRVSGKRMRRVDFDISALSEAQYETQYGDLWQRVGATDPVLVVPNSKQGAFLHDRILYGAITGGRVVNTFSPRYTRSFTIDSII